MVELKDYPTIDIMNHFNEIGTTEDANPFKYKEMQIMLQTTFKVLGKGGATPKEKPAKEPSANKEGQAKKKSASKMPLQD